ncbi:MAPK regulated corepressor interacting protein 2 [Crocuta crocuta]
MGAWSQDTGPEGPLILAQTHGGSLAEATRQGPHRASPAPASAPASAAAHLAFRRRRPSQAPLLKCRQPAPPTPPPPRAQPPGPWPLSSPVPGFVFADWLLRPPPATSPSLEGTQETYTLAHEENVRFVSEAWQQVEQQLGGGPAGESGPRPVQYVEKTPNPRLQNFVPIDLDEWWAQQFLARITNCS